jgi:hypothetical protein
MCTRARAGGAPPCAGAASREGRGQRARCAGVPAVIWCADTSRRRRPHRAVAGRDSAPACGEMVTSSITPRGAPNTARSAPRCSAASMNGTHAPRAGRSRRSRPACTPAHRPAPLDRVAQPLVARDVARPWRRAGIAGGPDCAAPKPSTRARASRRAWQRVLFLEDQDATASPGIAPPDASASIRAVAIVPSHRSFAGFREASGGDSSATGTCSGHSRLGPAAEAQVRRVALDHPRDSPIDSSPLASWQVMVLLGPLAPVEDRDVARQHVGQVLEQPERAEIVHPRRAPLRAQARSRRGSSIVVRCPMPHQRRVPGSRPRSAPRRCGSPCDRRDRSCRPGRPLPATAACDQPRVLDREVRGADLPSRYRAAITLTALR